MSKSSHVTAHFQWAPRGGERCAVCTMFRPPHDCTAVESPVSPEGWCRYFESRGLAITHAARATHPFPSEDQKKAGNYPKGKFNWFGAEIAIENPKGSTRSGVGKDGKPWHVRQPAHYGYILATKAIDGDHVDVYIGDAPASQRVWVIDQLDADTKKYDEPKAMLSFPNKHVALATYRRAFSDGKDRVGHVTELSIPEFMVWKDRDAKHKFKGRHYASGGRVHYGDGGGLDPAVADTLRNYVPHSDIPPATPSTENRFMDDAATQAAEEQKAKQLENSGAFFGKYTIDKLDALNQRLHQVTGTPVSPLPWDPEQSVPAFAEKLLQALSHAPHHPAQELNAIKDDFLPLIAHAQRQKQLMDTQAYRQEKAPR